MIMLVYVDDCILISKDQEPMVTFIQSLQDGTEDFVFTDEGTLANYLGVCIDKHSDGKGFSMAQPLLIERIIKAVSFDLATTKGVRDNVPAGYPLFTKDSEGPAMKANWKYRSLIGMLGYPSGTTRPDISMATHQCARFSNHPRLLHELSLIHI